MDFEKQLLEENGHYIDVSPTVSVHNISHILDALDILLINHGNEIHSETTYGGYGFYNPITGEKLIEEGKSYYLESDNEVVVFEQNEQMINQFYRNNVYQLTDGRIKDKLIHRKKDNRNITIATTIGIVVFLLSIRFVNMLQHPIYQNNMVGQTSIV